jgi:hypothetical protein
MFDWLVRLMRKLTSRMRRRRSDLETYRPSNLHGRVR